LGPIPGSLINAAQNLRVTAPGDFNADGAVDSADYAVWRKGLGTIYAPADYDTWTANFGLAAAGEGNGAAGAPAVPEPATLPILCGTAIWITLRRSARTCVS
jgi:hypothetical protein